MWFGMHVLPPAMGRFAIFSPGYGSCFVIFLNGQGLSVVMGKFLLFVKNLSFFSESFLKRNLALQWYVAHSSHYYPENFSSGYGACFKNNV